MKIKLLIVLVLCGLLSNAQFTESFETGIPANWTVIDNGSAPGWVQTNSPAGGAQDGTGVASISFGSIAHDDYLITPGITVASGVNDRLSFYIKSRSSTFLESYEVLLSTSGVVDSDFSVVLQAEQDATSSWEQFEFNLGSYIGQTVYVAVRATDTDKFNLYVDNFVNDAAPSCVVPSSLTATNILATSADFNWTAGDSETKWEYALLLDSDPAPTSGTTTSALSFAATNLTAVTDYTFYVRANCGPSDSSDFISVDFSTPVLPPVNDACANATSLTVNSDYDCGVVTNGTIIGATDSGLGNSTCGGTEDDDVWYTFVATSTGHRVSLTNFTSGTTDMYMAFYDGTNGCGALGTAIDCSDPQSFDLTGLTIGTTYYVQVYTWTSSPNQTSTFDICVGSPPTCLAPSSGIASGVTTTSADLSWTSGGSGESSWEVEYGADGYIQGTGTTVTASSNPYTINGLTANTDYDYYVRANCGGGDLSDWAGPFSFATTCVVFNIPFSENFDSTSAGTTTSPNAPNCWSSIDSGSGAAYVYDSALSNVQSGTSAFRLFNSSNTTGDYLLISPEIAELTIDGVQVSFSVKGASGQDLEIGTITDPTDASTFTVLNTTTLTSSAYVDIELNIPTSTDSYIAIRHGQTGSFDNYYLDDFSFTEIPNCIAPTALTAENITTTTADLSWTSGGSGETAWEVEYGAEGYTQGMGTVVGAGSNPYQLTGLTGFTAYDYYVRANCGGSDFSEWTGPFSFYTGHCFSNPSSNDGNGIGQLDIAGTNFTSGGDITYEDFRATPVAIGNFVPLAIEFNTGFTYDTNIWIDFNQDLVYDSSEQVFDGVSTNANPTTLDASFLISTSTLAGTYNMRIGTADIGQSTPNPCYNGTFGVTIDLVLNFTPSTCIRPLDSTSLNITATTADLSWTSGGSGETAWEIEYGVPGFTIGAGINTITANSNPFTLNALLESTDYDYYIRANCGAGDFSGWAGPFSFTTPASCLVPSALAASNITATTADLSWTSGGSGETAWEIEYGADGFIQGAGTIVPTTSNLYTLNGLTATTAYDYFVRADCGGADFSAWAGPFSFTTPCGPVITYPYIADMTTHLPGDCWSEAASGEIVDGPSGTTSDWRGNRAYENNLGNVVASNAINLWQNVDREWLITEEYDLSSAANLFLTVEVAVTNYSSFSGVTTTSDTMGSDDAVDLLISTNSGATWTSLETWNVGNQPSVNGTEFTVDLSVYTGVVQFAFLASDGTTDDFQDYDFHVGVFEIAVSPIDFIWDGSSWSSIPEGNITSNDNLIVQSGTVPVLTAGIDVNNVTIEAGASLDVGNGGVNIFGTLTNNGAIAGVSKVVMDGTAAQSITGSGSMINLDINNAAGVSMDGAQSISGTLNVSNGVLSANGNLTLVSDATGTGSVGQVAAGAITGDVNVERYIPSGNRAYRFIGSTVSGPSVYDSWQEAGNSTAGFGVQITGTVGTVGAVNATTGHDETLSGANSMFNWDATNQGWVSIDNTKNQILNAGDYYRLFVRGDRTTDLSNNSAVPTATTLRATGELFTGSMAFTPTVNTGDFFALANPFQSKISMASATTAGVAADMYHWDPNLGSKGGYNTIDIANGTGTAGILTNANILDAGQAVFFVDTSGAASVTINESHKVAGNSNAAVFSTTPLQQALRLKLYQTSRFNNGQSESDGLYIDFDAVHNINVDFNDAAKWNGLNANMAILKPTGELLAVERRTLPTIAEVIALNITNYVTTTYTISATIDVLPGLTAYLKDNFTGNMTELVQGADTAVSFTVDMNNVQSSDPSRFEVIFQTITLSNDNLAFGNNLSIYPNPVTGDMITINLGGIIVEKATVQVYNTLGQQIMSNNYDNISNGFIELDNLSNLSNGVYIINISSGDAITTRRFIKE